MRLLLDTQAWIWFVTEPERLAPAVFERLVDTRNEIFVSTACVWEAVIKVATGKLRCRKPVEVLVDETQRRAHFAFLPVDVDHALTVAELPPIHRDPFDRVIAAQALVGQLTLVTSDELLRRYPVITLRADA